MPVVTDSSIDGRGEWVPNCDDGMLVPMLGMVCDMVKDCLEFYKRYAFYVSFSIRSGPTKKNKAGGGSLGSSMCPPNKNFVDLPRC